MLPKVGVCMYICASQAAAGSIAFCPRCTPAPPRLCYPLLGVIFSPAFTAFQINEEKALYCLGYKMVQFAPVTEKLY